MILGEVSQYNTTCSHL